ncbi:MAG: hypothetical protein WBB37_06640 [bacterium]
MPATWTYLEPGAQISQKFNDLRNLLNQHGITAISVTDNNDLLEFLSIVPKGYILLMSHGGNIYEQDALMVEAYDNVQDAENRVVMWQQHFGIGADMIWRANIYDTSQEPPTIIGYAVCINSAFLTPRLPMLPHSFVMIGACYSQNGIMSSFQSRNADTRVGWTTAAWISESSGSFDMLARLMAGAGMGSPQLNRNFSANDAILTIREYLQGPNYPHIASFTVAGDGNMRFYNSPRIVGLKVKQAGSMIYNYRFGEQGEPFYPYEWDYPGDLSSCSKNPAQIGNDFIEVWMLLSAPMDPNAANVALIPEQGNFAIPLSGNFSSTLFENDFWTGVCDFSEWSGGENAIVWVDAEDAFEGDINAKLDINGDGNSDGEDRNHKFRVELLPQVDATDPPSGRRATPENIDIYKQIEIVFNKTMDTASVRGALEIINIDNDSSEVTIKEIEWQPGDSIMFITAYDSVVGDKDTVGFDFYTNYEVKILGTAEDTSGITLDGDYDGKSEGSPEDDYVFSFRTRNPEFELAAAPMLAKIPTGGTQEIEVLLTNNEHRKLGIKLIRPADTTSNWIIEEVEPDSVNVAADSISTDAKFYVKNRGEPGATVAEILAKSHEEEKETEAVVWAYKPSGSGGGGQQYSEPWPPPSGCDESYSMSDHNFPSPWILNPRARIGLFLSGYAEGMGHLLGNYKIPTALVLDNFKIVGAFERPLSDLDVLVIPTGGFIPFANMPYYRNKLREFVEQGGTLICLTQSHGEIFEGLPGSPNGFGWAEDQSCHAYACYLNLWDTFFSGQNNIVFDANMDGYITQYPDGGEPFLIRIANGNPGFVRYPYGQGQVILTTGYTDFAYRFGGYFKDAINLIRDMITSYVILDPIPEYYKDSTVVLNARFYYPVYEDSIPANRAEIITYYPNRDSLRSDAVNLSPPMIPGDQRTIPLSSIAAPGSLGIYPLMFTLYQDTLAVTEEEYGNAFAVKCSIPVGNYNLGDFQLWATVEAESVLYGIPFEFNVNVRNRTMDTVPGKILVGNLGGFPPQFFPEDSLVDLNFPPETVAVFDWQTTLTNTRFYTFRLVDTSSTVLAWFNKWIQVIQPKAQVTLTCDSTGYQYHDTVHVNLDFLTNYDGVDTFKVIIYQRGGWIPIDTIFALKDTITYVKEGTSYAFPFYMSQELNPGTYTIKAEAYWRGKQSGWDFEQFLLIAPELQVSLLPDYEITGSDTANLVVSFDPPSYVDYDATLAYRIIYSDSTTDTLITNEITLDTIGHLDTLQAPFSLTPNVMNFGYYDFKYSLDAVESVNGYYDFSHWIWASLKKFQYRYYWGDTLDFGIRVQNKGDFTTPVWVIARAEKHQEDYIDSVQIDLDLDTDTTIFFQTIIDQGMPSGSYDLEGFVRSANTTRKAPGYYIVSVRPPQIIATLDTSLYSSGDTATVILYNAGDLEGDVRLTQVGIYDFQWSYFSLDTARYLIPGSDFAFYKFVVPEVLSGVYRLQIIGIVENHNIPIDKSIAFQINGIEADIALQTSKDVYLPYEEVKPQANCVNYGYQLNGEIYLKK